MEAGTFPDSGLPVAEILVLAGFLMIYMLEEVMHFVLVRFVHLGRYSLVVYHDSHDSIDTIADDDHEKHDNGGGHGHSHDNIVVPTEAGLQVWCH